MSNLETSKWYIFHFTLSVMFKNVYIFIKTEFGSHIDQEYACLEITVKTVRLHDFNNFRYLNFMADFRLNTISLLKNNLFYLFLQKISFPMSPHFSTIPRRVNVLRLIICHILWCVRRKYVPRNPRETTKILQYCRFAIRYILVYCYGDWGANFRSCPNLKT